MPVGGGDALAASSREARPAHDAIMVNQPRSRAAAARELQSAPQAGPGDERHRRDGQASQIVEDLLAALAELPDLVGVLEPLELGDIRAGQEVVGPSAFENHAAKSRIAADANDQ